MASSLVLNRSSKRPAEDTAAFGAIAERFRRAGALDKAVSLCQEGLKKFPDHVSARVTLGWALLDLGKYDEAREALELVLRRAPDNLAAIRGLAELHDRFEHTLNLPMDGPGQWPPTPADVEQLGDAGNPVVEIVGTDEALAASSGPFVPGGRDAREDAMDRADGIDRRAAEDGPMMAPPQMGLPIWAAVEPAPRAAAASATADLREDPPAATAPAATANAGSGMSSVREIEFSPASSPVAMVSAAAEAPVAEQVADHADGADQVGHVDLEALIAEADSLEAAALAVQAVEAADLNDAPAELSPVVTLDAAATLDLVGDVDLSAGPMAEAAVAEPYGTAEPMEALVAELERAPLPEPVSEPVLQLDELGVEPEALLQVEEPEAASPVAAFEAAEEAEAPEMAVQAEAVQAPEFAGTAETLEAAHALETGETAAVTEAPEPVRILDFAPAKAEATAESSVEDEAPAALVAAPAALRFHPALPALERFLSQVQARRAQLMAESVA